MHSRDHRPPSSPSPSSMAVVRRAARLLLAVPLSTGLLALPGLPAEAVTEWTCEIEWTGDAGDAQWSSPANWSYGRVPVEVDNVCIGPDAPATVWVSGAADQGARHLAAQTAIAVDLDDAATFAVTNTSRVDRLRIKQGTVDVDESLHAVDLEQDGGRLTGRGSLVVEGFLKWTAGAQDGFGTTYVGHPDTPADPRSTALVTRSTDSAESGAAVLDRRLVTQEWTGASGSALDVADDGLLTVTGTTTVGGTGRVTGQGRVRLEGDLRSDGTADWSVAPLTTEVFGEIAIDAGTTAPVPGEPATYVDLGAEAGALTLDGRVSLGGGGGLGLLGKVRQSAAASVAGSGTLSYLGRRTSADVGSALSVDVTVSGARVDLEQSLYADHLWVRDGGELTAGADVVSASETLVEDGRIVAHRIGADEHLTLRRGGTVEGSSLTDDPARTTTPLLEVSGTGRVIATTLDAASITVEPGADAEAGQLVLDGDVTADVHSLDLVDSQVLAADDSTATMTVARLAADGDAALEVPTIVTERATGAAGSELTLGRRAVLWGQGMVDRLDVAGETTVRGEVAVAGRVDVRSSASLTLIDGSLGGPQAELVNHGTLTGHGHLIGAVTNAGEVDPLLQPLAVDGSFAQTDAGALWLADPQHSSLEVAGPVTLAGALGVREGAPVVDAGVDVVRGAAVSGRFADQRGSATCAEVVYAADRVSVRPRACLAVGDASGFEGDVAAFGLTLPSPATRQLSVSYRLVPGTAGATDWAGPTHGTLTVPDGQDSATLVVPLVEDDDTEGDETFTVELTSDQVRLDAPTVAGIIHESALDADYRWVHLPRLGAGWRPWALGTSRVAGTWTPTTGEDQGWVFDPSTGELAGTRDGFIPQAFNRHDVAVGACAGGACVRDHGTETLLRHPQGATPLAADITDDGTVVGTLVRPDGSREIAVWITAGAQPQVRTGLSGLTDVSVARSSERGHLSGTGVRDGALVAWLLDARGIHVAPLPTEWGRPQVVGVSDDGVVAGQSVTDGGVPRGWRWSPALGLRDLGERTYVLDADDRGQLAGGVLGVDGSRSARIWRGHWITLGSALAGVVSEQYDGSLRLETAQLVNDQGTVVVEGRTSDGVRTGVLVRRDAGCEVCVTSTLEEATWPRAGDFAPAGDTSTEGNPARVSTRVVNRDRVQRALTVTLTSPDGDDLSRRDLVLAPGQETTLTDAVSLDGLAWQEGAERDTVDFVVRVLDQQGAEVAARTLRTRVVPRPVVMVHGMNSDAATWSAYAGFLSSAHSRWKGYAVDTMRTGLGDSQPIRVNANELSMFVARTQGRENAFQVDLVAHSMGGLISRYYIHHQVPGADASPRAVRRLVMLGTPNAGSFCADLFRIPMTAELRTDAVASFNASVTDRKGVPFSVGIGTVLPATCGSPGDSDSVVSSESAHHGVDDVQYFSRWHTDMTASSQMFTSYVLPRLQGHGMGSPSPASARSTTGASAVPDTTQPQVLARDELHLSPGGSASVQVPVPAADRLLATALGRDVQVTLRKGAESAASPASDQPQPFATASVADPASGTWDITVVNHGSSSVTVPLTTWTTGTSSTLGVTATQVGRGVVRLTASVTGQASVREMESTLVPVDGTPVDGPVLHDDGQDGDDAAGDGTWTALVLQVPQGPAVVDVHAAGTDFQRIVSAYVGVVDVEDGPGDDAPVAFDGTTDAGGGETTLLEMSAVDPEGADLTYDVVEGPTHGRLSGSYPFGYRPEDGFAGTDVVRWRVSDGRQWSTTATTTVRVGRVATEVVLSQPSDRVLHGGLPQTVSVAVRRMDGTSVQQGQVQYRLGDQVLMGRLDEGVGVRFDVPATEGTLPLVATFLGTDAAAPSTLTTTLHVDTGTAPAPEVEPVVGEAGYPLRVRVHHHDVEDDVVRVQLDWDGDGTFEADLRRGVTTGERWQPQTTEVDTTYAEPVTDGRLVARVTDGGGHVVTVGTTVQIAPHRELGHLRRLTVDGESVLGSDISWDGTKVLVEDASPDGAGFLPLGQYGVLTLSGASVQRATVLPDGSWATAPADVVLSPDGTRVAFTSPSTIAGRWVRQAYVRDLVSGRTVLASARVGTGPATDGVDTVDVTDDGRVLMTSAARDLLMAAPQECSWTSCVRLYEGDTATGLTRLLSAPTGRPVDTEAFYSSDGAAVVWSETGTSVHVRDLVPGGPPTALTLPSGTSEVAVAGISDGGRLVTFAAGTTVGGTAVRDVLQLDRTTGAIGVVSTTADGALVAGGARGPAATDATGGRVVWASPRSTIVGDDTNQHDDVFLHEGGRTGRISVEGRDGSQGDGDSRLTHGRAMSGNGRWVLFTSAAGNLVPGDLGRGDQDTFVLDLGPSTPPPTDNRPPEVALDGPTTAPEGATLALATSVTDVDGDEVDFTWEVDGGTLDVGADRRSALLAVGDGPAVRTVTLRADDGTTTVTRTLTVRIDNVAPTLLLDTTAVTREVGQPLALHPTVIDVPDDVVSCRFEWGDGAVEQSADCAAEHAWTTAGVRSVRVLASDDDGGSTSLTVPVTVSPQRSQWPWDGFFQPVDNLPVVNTAKAGQAIPVKFSLGGYRGMDVLAPGFPRSGVTSCTGDGVYDAIESTDSAGASTLTYDPVTGRYHYVWKTSKTWAGQCRTLVVRLADGSEHTAQFRLR